MKKSLLAAATLAAPLLLLSATTAQATAAPGRTTMEVTCAGQVLTVTTAGGNDGDNWGSAQVEGGGHLVLAALDYRVDDETAGVTLDDEVLSHGRAHAQQRTIVCQVATETARLGDVAPDGFVYPAGTSADDQVVMSLHVTVVPVP